MLHFTRTSLTLLLLLSIFSILVCSQHTTSARFTPQPTSSGVVCIQMICPSPDSAQPTCPSDCSSGCKMIPDQCCPQLTVAVCQDSHGSSSSITGAPSASTTLGTATGTTASPTLSSMVSSSSSSSSSPSSSISSTPSPNSNFSVILQPSVPCLLGLAIFMLYLLSY